MAKSNDELLAIRNESYRVVHAEVCRTCRHWSRLRTSGNGACRIVNEGKSLSPLITSPLGTCDLWEGRQRDQ